MSRLFVSVLLFLMLGIFLGRDASQPDGELELTLTEAEYEDIIQRYLNAQDDWLICDCAAPTTDCDQVCNAPISNNGNWCGTPAVQADARIREAIEAGATPKAIAELIEANPYPFSKEYIVKNYVSREPIIPN